MDQHNSAEHLRRSTINMDIPIPSLDTPDLGGTLVPPWYYEAPPNLPDMFLATFIWGFTIAVSSFSLAKAVRQTYRSWTRSHKVNAYIVMVWLEWMSCVATTATSWLFLENFINPSVWYFTGMLTMWTIQTQCLMQIMANRIALIMYNPDRARKLKWIVGLSIGIINISVFCIWVPARLQISEKYIRANDIWDRAEKCIFLVIDGVLNGYFMYLIKSKLVANGLVKYKLVYRFNLGMVIFSLSLDAMIIGLMSLPDDDVYVQLHPAAYLIKLHIEMNIAELLGKVLKRSNCRRNSLAGRSHSYDNTHFGNNSTYSPSCVSPGPSPTSGRPSVNSDPFHRERRLLSLETALVDTDDDFFDFRCDGGGIHEDWGYVSLQRNSLLGNGSALPRHDDDNVEPKETESGSTTMDMCNCDGHVEKEHDGSSRRNSDAGQKQANRPHVQIVGAGITRPEPVHRKDSAWSGTGTASSCMTEPVSEDGTSHDRDSVATI